MTVRRILTDIEGTTSAISFVHDVLFPYARAVLPTFVIESIAIPEVREQVDAVRAAAKEPDADVGRVGEILTGWIDEDRKATPLKALQGMVWRAGYETGQFTGHVYEDAVAGLQRWHASGIDLFVYSSGSVPAQKLMFGYSDAGDLTPLISGWFDTRVGHKKEAASYAAIVEQTGGVANDMLFLSDVVEELDAATAVGLRTCQLVRDDDMDIGAHPIARTFDDVIID